VKTELRVTLLLAAAIGVCAGPFASAQQKQTEQTQQAAPEQEKKDTARRRIEWFYNQRAFPLGRIPAGARVNALRQLDQMLVREGKLVRKPDGTIAAPAPPEGAAAAPAVNPWTSIGPQPTTSIISAVGSVSGRVTAIAVDPKNSSIVYLGGAQGGVWMTTDGGNSWVPLTDGQASLAIGSLAVDPSTCGISGCQTIYAGTGEENFGVDSYYGAGVLKSIDGGNTWSQLGANPGSITNVPGITSFVGPFSGGFSPGGGARIGALAVSPTNPSIILAGVQIFVPPWQSAPRTPASSLRVSRSLC